MQGADKGSLFLGRLDQGLVGNAESTHVNRPKGKAPACSRCWKVLQYHKKTYKRITCDEYALPLVDLFKVGNEQIVSVISKICWDQTSWIRRHSCNTSCSFALRRNSSQSSSQSKRRGVYQVLTLGCFLPGRYWFQPKALVSIAIQTSESDPWPQWTPAWASLHGSLGAI